VDRGSDVMKILMATQIPDYPPWRTYIHQWHKTKDSPLLEGQREWFWKCALEKLGHEVQVFIFNRSILLPDVWQLAWGDFEQRYLPQFARLRRKIKVRLPQLSLDIRLRNRALLIHARQFQPDLFILTGNTNFVLAETVRQIKNETGCKAVLTHGTSPAMTAQYNERAMLPFLDYVFCNDLYHAVSWREMGARHALALPLSACDPNYHKRFELTEQEQSEYTVDGNRSDGIGSTDQHWRPGCWATATGADHHE